MLYIDNRAGSKELAPLLTARGLPVSLCRLDYGDVSFMGTGPEGIPVAVGVEVKTIHDVLNCITTGRFAGHQLPGLVKSYNQVWLLIGGLWRESKKTGLLEIRRKKGDWQEALIGTRRFMYTDLVTWLCTVSIKGGTIITRVSDWDEGTSWLSSLYHWWTKGWDGHKSHLAFHDGTRHGTPFARTNGGMINAYADRALLTRPTTARMVAAQLPQIGWQKSAALVKRFKTVACPYCPPCSHGVALSSTAAEVFEEVEGIGPTLAKGIYDSLRSTK